MRAIDTFILRGVTRLAHAVQRLTGWSTYVLMWACAQWWVGSELVRLTAVYVPIIPTITVPKEGAMTYRLFMSMLCLWLGVLGCVRAREARRAEESFRANPTTLPANVAVYHHDKMMTVRFLFVCFVVGVVIFSLMTPTHWTEWITEALYPMWASMLFASVKPLPPCESTIREWSRSIGAFFARRQPIAPTA